jgi:Tfp pilus assembly protein FimT
MHNPRLKAFTLLEVIVIIGAFLALTLIFLPIGIEQLQTNKIDIVVKDIKSLIYNQSQKAFAFKESKSYGMAFFTDHYIVFSGDTLATADSQSRIDLSREISITNISFNDAGNELRFEKGGFRPHTYGSFQITTGDATYKLTINSEGLLLVEKI